VLGLQHVRTAFEERRGKPHGYGRGRLQCLERRSAGDGSGRPSKEQGQEIFLADDLPVQVQLRASGLVHLCLSRHHRQLVARTALELVDVELERSFVVDDGPPGDLPLRIELAKRHVALGDLGHQGDEHRPAPIVGGDVLRDCSLVGPADAPPQVDLPGDLRVDLEDGPGLRVFGRNAQASPSVGGGGVGGQRRQKLGFRQPGSRGSLLHAGDRRPDIAAVLHRLAEQLHQDRVLEHRPPGEVGQ